MLRAGLDEDFRGCAPHDHEAVAVVLCLEVPHVLAKLLGQVALGLPLLHVRAVQPRDVVVLEYRRHRLDGREEVLDRLEMLVFEDAGFLCGGVRVIRNRVPRAKHDVLQRGERNEVLDERRAVVGALAEPDGGHLGERADGAARATANVLDPGHERRGDGAETRGENAELAGGRTRRGPCVGSGTLH